MIKDYTLRDKIHQKVSLTKPMPSLSVIIITKNEAQKIARCLESVKFANEIIILDSGSTDETVAIALQYTKQVHHVDWPGFGIQKNRALDLCQSDWVLSLDADEQLPPQLQLEIQAVLKQNPPVNAFTLLRKSTYCGRLISYGDWRGDYCLRLFRNGTARFKEVPIHEKLIVQGKTQTLQHPLLHHPFESLEAVLNKINTYSTLSALHQYHLGKKGTFFKAITHGLWTFFRGYILKFGFLDGKMGFLLAFSNAEGCYYRYLKILLLGSND